MMMQKITINNGDRADEIFENINNQHKILSSVLKLFPDAKIKKEKLEKYNYTYSSKLVNAKYNYVEFLDVSYVRGLWVKPVFKLPITIDNNDFNIIVRSVP